MDGLVTAGIRGRIGKWVWAKVVDAGRMTTIDEDTFYSRCQTAGEAITARSGLPDKAKFPTW